MSLPVWCFVVGMVAGCGPCFATCAPTVVSCVGGLKRGWKEGLVASLTFCLARIPAYLLLGVMVSYFGTRLHDTPALTDLQGAVRTLTGALLVATARPAHAAASSGKVPRTARQRTAPSAGINQ